MTLSHIISQFETDRKTSYSFHARDYANWFAGIEVQTGSGSSAMVRARKYRVNRADSGNDGRIADADADNERRRASQSIQRYVLGLRQDGEQNLLRAVDGLISSGFVSQSGRAGPRVTRVFSGKSNPADIAATLSLLCHAGRMADFRPSAGEHAALQAYCDAFIGVDCSGLVNGFFVTTQQFAEPNLDTLNTGWNIANYARQGRVLATAPASITNHVLCWTRGNTFTQYSPNAPIAFSHIALIECWVAPPNPAIGSAVGAMFRCAQSSSSMGGVNTSVYQIEEAPPLDHRGRNPALWRIRRVEGRSDAANNPRCVWSDVFLAPPPR